MNFVHVRRWTALGLALVSGCGTAEGPVGDDNGSGTQTDLEAVAGWHAGEHGNVRSQTGARSVVEVTGGGRLVVDTPRLSPPHDPRFIHLAVRIPTTLGGATWAGRLEIFVEDEDTPSGFHFVNSASLSNSKRGVFVPFDLEIPQHLRALFARDVALRVVIKAPETAGAYYLDELSVTDGPVTAMAVQGVQTLTMQLPRDIALQNLALYGRDRLEVRDGVQVTGAAGLQVANAGADGVLLGSDSRLVGSVRALGSVMLYDRARVQGDVFTQGTFSHQNQFAVTGQVVTNATLTPTAQVTLDLEFPPASQPIFLGPDQQLALTPGSYKSVTLHPRAKLTLEPGDYYFESLQVESTAELAFSGAGSPYVLYVENGITYRGKMPTAPTADVMLIQLGSSHVDIDAPFRGTLVAPNASVRLSPVNGQGHDGSFFAQRLMAEARNPVRHVPFAHWQSLLFDPATDGHDSPSAWIRARWVYPNGEPLRSFSYAPLPAPSAQFKTPVLMAPGLPNEEPTTALSFEVQNVSTVGGGREVAYSIVMKSWGLGNFYGDVVLAAADASETLAPGESRTIDIPNLKDTLGIQALDMPAKGDLIMGLHDLTDTGVAPEPFAFVRLPQFFYHFSDDLSEVYTYSLEMADPVLAPQGMAPKEGVVERYAQGAFTADLFAPNGTVNGVDDEQARQNLRAAFADRPAHLFGIRWDTHDPGSQPGDPIPPAAPVGAPPAPYDPAAGPTGVCATWPTTFVDNGTEPFPIRSTNEFEGIVDFLPAAFNRMQLFQADGVLLYDGTSDANGCIPAQQLGQGNYLLRVFADGVEDDSARIQVHRLEPPNGPERAVTVTYAVFLEYPGNTSPGGFTGFTVTTGMWTNTTHVSGFASHVLSREAQGVDLGLTRDSTSKPVYQILVNTESVSHYRPDLDTLNIDAVNDDNSWVSDARWKFVLAHEFGHAIQDFGGAGLPSVYSFNGNTSFSGGTPDPDSARTDPAEVAACTCDIVDPSNRSHCLNSVEVSASAQQEGFAHFIAATAWNYAPVDAAYDEDGCNFVYYKESSAPNLVPLPTIPPFSVSCSQAYNHRQVCSGVSIDNHEEGTEIDWLTFYWALTHSGEDVQLEELFTWYQNTCGGACNDVFVTFADLAANVPAEHQATFVSLGAEHGVD